MIYCVALRSLFSICIYGAQDTLSRRIDHLRVWTSDNKSIIVDKFYFDYLFERKVEWLNLPLFKLIFNFRLLTPLFNI